MKKIILAIAAWALTVAALSAQSVDEIVARHLNAIGGAEKLQKVKSVIMENTIKVQGLDFENINTILVGKAIRTESKIMGNSMIQAFDGDTAWSVTPVLMGGNGEPQVLSEEMARSIITQTDLFPLLDYLKKGISVTLMTAEKVKDKETYHLKISPKAGAASEVWIDVSSGLISKLKTVQNGQEVEAFFSNYTEIEGIKFSMTMETANPMAGTITIDTKTVKLNTPIDGSVFKMPIKK
jgi:outer membrane lipoprotein-sorting protein